MNRIKIENIYVYNTSIKYIDNCFNEAINNGTILYIKEKDNNSFLKIN
ncbi:hypothetical protein [Clostridium sp.]|nr:hypothetical protein [Clostridium sp.]